MNNTYGPFGVEVFDNRLPNVWKKLQKALDDGGNTYTLWDVREAICSGKFDVWAHNSSIIIAYMDHYPQLTRYMQFLGAGDFKELKEMQPSIEEYARARGCAAIAAGGRKGWMRHPDRASGWRIAAQYCLKDL